MDADDFAEWLDSYREAWERMDPTLAGELFTETAKYHQTPFEEPFEGRTAIEDYWRDITAGQNDPQVEVDAFAFGDDEGIGHFHAEYVDDEGGQVTLDGVCVVTFEGDLGSEFLEWWHMETA